MRRMTENEKISLTELKKFYGRKGVNLSDAELIRVRNWIYQVAEWTLEYIETRTPQEIERLKRLFEGTT